MKSFSWFDRLPKLDDDIVHIAFSLEEEDDALDANQASENLSDLFIYIEYTNAGGIASRRPITIKREGVSGGNPCLYAYCHARKSFRQFRLDRITSIITTDGEIYEPAAKFWRLIGYDVGSQTESRAVTPNDRYAALSIKRKFNHELVVLAALSGSDGNMHKREVDQIVDYVERELEWDRTAIHPDEISALKNHIKRMRITQERLSESVNELLVNPSRFHLYERQLDRFINAAKQVITADAVLHPAELEFIEYLDMTIRG